MTRSMSALTAVLCGAMALGQASVGRSQQAPAAGEPIFIRGQTEPKDKIEVPSLLRGKIDQELVKEGEKVSANQAIAKMDDAVQLQVVALAKFEAESTVKIRKAETDLLFAQNEMDRYKRMGDVASQSERREKELAVKQAELALEQAKEEVSEKKIDLAKEQVTEDRMTIKSPIAGTVLRFAKHAGESIDETQPVATVVNTSKLNAVFYPPKALFGKVNQNDKVNVELATEPPVTRQAVVTVVDPTIDPAAQLFRVKLEIDNADEKIPAGTAATWTWTGKALAAK